MKEYNKEYKKEYESGQKRTTLLILNIILIILLLLTSAFTITLAVMKFGFNIGGDVNFQATDIQATISAGQVSNGTVQNASEKMKSINLTPDIQDEATLLEAKESWKNLEITFNGKEDVKLSFSITNNHPEKALKVSLDVTEGTLNNMTISTKMGNTNKNSFIIASKTNEATTINCEIIFHIVDNTKSADIKNFSINYNLELTDEEPDVVNPIYERVDEEGNPSEDGKYIYFGYYPQTIKNSSVKVEEQPEENGYYKGSDGELYAKVTIEFDVAKYEEGMMLADFSDGTRAEQDQTYYFKVERLRWRILDEQEDGKTLIVCDTVIDNVIWQPNYKYENGKYYATDDEGTILLDEENNKIYANNYEYSQIRYFLNNEFYNSAFSSEQKQMILQTEVDNSLESTLGQGGQYVCENTLDNVFLLSLSDVNNPEYGFKDSSTAESEIDMIDSARNFKTTDFSKAKGSATISKELIESGFGDSPEMVELMSSAIGCGVGWLRSPNVSNFGYNAFDVAFGLYANLYVSYDDLGVVPALQIQL